jgi:hypothetical protein
VFSYSKDFERVLSVWRQMSATGFAPTARLWGSLLLACSAAGQLEQAGIVWWEMRQLHSQGLGDVLITDNVCGMMTACNDAGQYERSLAAFEEARSLGVPMDTRAFNIALRACHTPGKTLRQEQLLHAFALYDELKRSGLRPDTYTFGTLFSLCAAAHQGHCALQASWGSGWGAVRSWFTLLHLAPCWFGRGLAGIPAASASPPPLVPRPPPLSFLPPCSCTTRCWSCGCRRMWWR